MIFVDGKSDKSFCIAIVIPNEAAFRRWARGQRLDISGDSTRCVKILRSTFVLAHMQELQRLMDG